MVSGAKVAAIHIRTKHQDVSRENKVAWETRWPGKQGGLGNKVAWETRWPDQHWHITLSNVAEVHTTFAECRSLMVPKATTGTESASATCTTEELDQAADEESWSYLPLRPHCGHTSYIIPRAPKSVNCITGIPSDQRAFLLPPSDSMRRLMPSS